MKLSVSEKIVTQSCIQWLKIQGWTCIRLNSGLMQTPDGRRMRVGTPGLPDWIAVRGGRYYFLELKAHGKKLSAAQEEWFTLARINRLNAIWADSLEMLLEKYHEENRMPSVKSA